MEKVIERKNVLIRVRKDSWEAVTEILKDTGMTPNQYVTLLIESLAMSETKSYKDLMNFIVESIFKTGVEKKKKR